MYVLGVSGNLRRASYNTALLRAAAELMPRSMTPEIFELAPLTLFNADAEKPFPEAAVELRTRLAQVDGLLIATPEYNS
jgi:chromate reductase